jgi:hypothetical protein
MVLAGPGGGGRLGLNRSTLAFRMKSSISGPGEAWEAAGEAPWRAHG